ncbi:MAG: hypothetical protein KH501_09225, partial [Eubacterium limosum]|nr:hypothetical protein [Eubacterium limosum]
MGQRLSPIKTPKATYEHTYVAFGVFCLKNIKKGEKNGTGNIFERTAESTGIKFGDLSQKALR